MQLLARPRIVLILIREPSYLTRSDAVAAISYHPRGVGAHQVAENDPALPTLNHVQHPSEATTNAEWDRD